MSTIPTTSAPGGAETIEQRFERLADRWQEETAALASPADKAAHPAFREIVSMGKAVIPFILRRIVKREEHWDLALAEITGERPFPPTIEQRSLLLEQFWLIWAAEKGYAVPVEDAISPNGPVASAPGAAETLEQHFEQLADQWELESAYLSSPDQTVALPAFQAILRMGEAVIPFVLRRMQQRKGPWFLALSRITGEKPFPPSAAGKVRLMEEAWFTWARRKGYV